MTGSHAVSLIRVAALRRNSAPRVLRLAFMLFIVYLCPMRTAYSQVVP